YGRERAKSRVATGPVNYPSSGESKYSFLFLAHRTVSSAILQGLDTLTASGRDHAKSHGPYWQWPKADSTDQSGLKSKTRRPLVGRPQALPWSTLTPPQGRLEFR